MPVNETTIMHKGEPFSLPFKVYEATSVHLYALFEYETACRLCDGENFTPTLITNKDGGRKAGGFVSVIDNRKTSAVSYHEWSLGIFVSGLNRSTPKVQYVNAASLFFQSMLNDERIGNMTFCPGLILDEPLPTELGREYYGIPKELGQVRYDYCRNLSEFIVASEGQTIMQAGFPTRRGLTAKLQILILLLRAFSLRQVALSMKQKEYYATLAGSSKILAKKAYIKVAKDPATEMFPWNSRNCWIDVNSESKWGNMLTELKFEPKLVCHVPNLSFEFSAPEDQMLA